MIRGRFFPIWVTASAIGAGLGVLLWVGLGAILETSGFDPSSPLLPVLVGAAFGAMLGTGQWLVIRRRIDQAARWVLATTIGFAFVFLLGVFLPHDAVHLSATSQIALGFGFGAAVALPPSSLQWLLVLRWQVSGAGWWIPASMLAWAIAFATSFGLRLAFGDLSFVAGPFIAFALTGLALSRLLDVTRERRAA